MKRLIASLALLMLACVFHSAAHSQALYPLCLSPTNPPSGPAILCPANVPITVQGGTIAGGTTFTLGTGTGACATSSTLTGGAVAGSFVCTGTAGASTQVVNLPTSAHGWACTVVDVTSGVTGETVAPVAINAATLKVTIATTSDVVQFSCAGY